MVTEGRQRVFGHDEHRRRSVFKYEVPAPPQGRLTVDPKILVRPTHSALSATEQSALISGENLIGVII